jgi:hypothetical protein
MSPQSARDLRLVKRFRVPEQQGKQRVHHFAIVEVISNREQARIMPPRSALTPNPPKLHDMQQTMDLLARRTGKVVDSPKPAEKQPEKCAEPSKEPVLSTPLGDTGPLSPSGLQPAPRPSVPALEWHPAERVPNCDKRTWRRQSVCGRFSVLAEHSEAGWVYIAFAIPLDGSTAQVLGRGVTFPEAVEWCR